MQERRPGKRLSSAVFYVMKCCLLQQFQAVVTHFYMPVNSGANRQLSLSRQFRGVLYGDEIHFLRNLRHEVFAECLRFRKKLVHRNIAPSAQDSCRFVPRDDSGIKNNVTKRLNRYELSIKIFVVQIMIYAYNKKNEDSDCVQEALGRLK